MNTETLTLHPLETKIYLIRGHKVMLDHDLAELYQVPTKRLNEQVRRNLRRFPQDFMFSLTEQEVSVLRSQFATANYASRMRRSNPLAFTEQGIAMLSSVLTSDRAADVNVAIMRTFVNLREVLKSNSELEKQILALESKCEGKFKIVFDALHEIMSERSVPRKQIIGLSPDKK